MKLGWEATGSRVMCERSPYIYPPSKVAVSQSNGSGVTPQVNFLRKITFDTLYTNEFVIRVRSRALAILSERTTL